MVWNQQHTEADAVNGFISAHVYIIVIILVVTTEKIDACNFGMETVINGAKA